MYASVSYVLRMPMLHVQLQKSDIRVLTLHRFALSWNLHNRAQPNGSPIRDSSYRICNAFNSFLNIRYWRYIKGASWRVRWR